MLLTVTVFCFLLGGGPRIGSSLSVLCFDVDFGFLVELDAFGAIYEGQYMDIWAGSRGGTEGKIWTTASTGIEFGESRENGGMI